MVLTLYEKIDIWFLVESYTHSVLKELKNEEVPLDLLHFFLIHFMSIVRQYPVNGQLWIDIMLTRS